MLQEMSSAALISARTWAARWDCSLSSIRRAAQRLPVRRVHIGAPSKALVRFVLADIEQIERQRTGVSQTDDVAEEAGGK